MLEQFSRTEMIIGTDGMNKLTNSKVAIFGIGGVGSYAAEGLARAGIGKFVLIDNDKICLSNINRQIHAMTSTVGRNKVNVMRERILDINPKAEVQTYEEFYLPNKNQDILDGTISYIVDAIDTVTAKIDLVVQADKLKIPIISSMGTGNKIEPIKLEVSDIYKTSVCPLAKVMRKELRAREIKNLKVVYSKEEPIKVERDEEKAKQTPGSISFVPSVAGLIIASEVVKDLIYKN